MKTALKIIILILCLSSCRTQKNPYGIPDEELPYVNLEQYEKEIKPCISYYTCKEFNPIDGVQSDYNIFKCKDKGSDSNYEFYFLCPKNKNFEPDKYDYIILDTIQYFCPSVR